MMNTLGRRLADATLMDVLDRFNREINPPTQNGDSAGLWHPSGLEVWEDEHNIHVEAELAGIKPEDVDITVENGVLTIRGEKKQVQRDKVQYHYRYRRYGQFVQQVQLPSTVDPARVEANLRDGVLSVQVEKRPEVKPRRIEVKAG